MIIYGTTYDESETAFIKENNLGVEVLQYSNPLFADAFEQNHPQITEYISGASAVSMHGAYHDTFYASVDPLICEVAKKRFLQSIEIATFHGINHVVFHSSYRQFLNGSSAIASDVFVKTSVAFWDDMKKHIPKNMTIYLENVEDADPELFLQVLDGIASQQIRCCFDIGHAYFNGRDVSLNRWIDVLRDHIRYVHVHDNDGMFDDHLPLGQGSILLPGAINKIMHAAGEDIPFILECNIQESVKWLRDIGYEI